MRCNSLVLFAAALLCLPCSCRSQDSAIGAAAPLYSGPDNSETSLDWPGVYKGTLPCGDCPGISTTLILRLDRTFRTEMRYIDRKVEPFVQEGTFTWLPGGSVISCSDGKGQHQLYFVGENMIIQLDGDGKRITGDLAERFILRKVASEPARVPDASLQETRWSLTMLMGKPVVAPERQREAFMVLNRRDSRVEGFGGCNRFFGSYDVMPGNRIRFSKIGATRMACPDMQTEQALFRVLETVDNYTIRGNVLQLNRARMAPLARFEATYLK
jgi:heat shock protein HslJ